MSLNPSPAQLLPRASRRFFPDRFAEVVKCTVVDLNLKSWTVDVVSGTLGRYWADVQVGSPYLHQQHGEGVYCVPEVGATCMVCLPTDMSGPFVVAFVSPGTTISARGKAGETGMTPDEYKSYAAKQANRDIDYSYSSNRPPAKPGDIVARGRDGNYVVLHRGGVLELGAGPLCQRMFVPLSNLMVDTAERYEQHGPGGMVRWGMQDLGGKERGTEWQQTLRVHADQRYCDVRITRGKVLEPVKLPPGTPDPTQGTLVYEVALIPASPTEGFRDNGQLAGESHHSLKLMFRFDLAGNALLWADGDMTIATRRNLALRARAMTLELESMQCRAKGDAGIDAKGMARLNGQIVELGGGSTGVARHMDMVMVPAENLVQMLAMLGVTMGAPPIPGTALYGAILTASTKVKTA